LPQTIKLSTKPLSYNGLRFIIPVDLLGDPLRVIIKANRPLWGINGDLVALYLFDNSIPLVGNPLADNLAVRVQDIVPKYGEMKSSPL